MPATEVALKLPDIATLRAVSQSIAVLDAILSPEGYGARGFDSRWAPGMELAWMDNGSGDEYSIVFSAAGAFIRAFDHESEMSPYVTDDDELWPGLIESVPEMFGAYLVEPAFCHEGADGPFLGATAVLWRTNDDEQWRTGEIDYPSGGDGSDWMFQLLIDGSPEAYRAWATDYFEVTLGLGDVRHVFEARPLTPELVQRIKPETDLSALTKTIEQIGYAI